MLYFRLYALLYSISLYFLYVNANHANANVNQTQTQTLKNNVNNYYETKNDIFKYYECNKFPTIIHMIFNPKKYYACVKKYDSGHTNYTHWNFNVSDHDTFSCKNNGIMLNDWFFGVKCNCENTNFYGIECEIKCPNDIFISPNRCHRNNCKNIPRHCHLNVDNCKNNGFMVHTKNGPKCNCYSTGHYGILCENKCALFDDYTSINDYPKECINI